MNQGAESRGRPGRSLMDRDIELGAVDAALSELTGTGGGPGAHGTGGLIAFAAPAGGGKTALLAELRRRAAARGCTVLSARGGEQERGVALHVVRQLVQPVLAASGEADRRRMWAPGTTSSRPPSA
ncbi:hypothetical protein [Streptomyces pactum]|uniref:hypothetical protein n=1 Tax=Streptomyces pactum TaxID=68249 RepID=UPI0027DE46E0|nr:hypothetical protein [Streptomyces pactum]